MHAGTVSPLRLPQDAGPAVGRARRHAARRYVAVALAAATAILTGAMVLGADPAPTPLVRAAPPGATLADAARAADRGDVLTAVGIAADLGQPEQDRIRRKISRVLAAQAAAAVAAGD
ncbi:MAG: hypothetical protein HZB46_15670, partial [Solirubrobacterales bacterium]|nr:hypothetical protein [Solirubrobacterales bacterium]